MKWFKHYTKALSDAKIEKLIMKYGIEGYGLYFACLELIAGNLTDENITFELEHDSEILAYKFKIDTLKIEEMMKYMIQIELFEVNEVTNRITCIKLAKNLDSSCVKSPHLLQIKKNIQEKSRKVMLEQNRTEQNRIEQNRTEQNRTEQNSSFVKPTLEEIQDYLNELNIKSFTSNKFFDFYESKGWFVGKNKMKNWKACVRTWKSKETENKKVIAKNPYMTHAELLAKEKLENEGN